MKLKEKFETLKVITSLCALFTFIYVLICREYMFLIIGFILLVANLVLNDSKKTKNKKKVDNKSQTNSDISLSVLLKKWYIDINNWLNS